MKGLLAALLATGVLGLGAAMATSAPARVEQATRVVDLTVTCPIPVRAGVREIELSAISGVRLREDRSKWLRLANALTSLPMGESVFVSAGAPLALEPGRPDDGVRLYAHGVCAPDRRSIPLSRRSLAGGVSGQLGERWDCVVPSRVAIRVRAVFRRATAPRMKRYGITGRSWTARVGIGTVQDGSLSVRTLGGRPIAYADVHESGRARLFVARTCVPD